MFAIVDIETTGSKFPGNRIIDLAIIRHNGKEVVSEWHSLLRPDVAIPPFVIELTGISEEMVAEAPLFQDVAVDVIAQLRDCIFVAHDVNFDYSFLRHELKEVGYTYFPGSGPGGPLREGGLMMSIGCSQVGKTTLAHEMGHYLALPHTFDGSSTDPISPFAERVTRNPNEVAPRFSANCNTFGDRYCDTPADIYGFRWNCNGMALNDTDLNGDTFLPDAGYFMSYSSDFCMNKFSQQQMNTMRQTVRSSSTTPAPRNYLTVFPMPAWDTVTSNVTLLEPLASSAPSPSNFIFFRWSKAPGATHYFVRIRRNNLPVTEFTTTDTTRLFTINLLQPGLTYTYTIRPYNHGWTCVGPSQTGTFTTTQGYGVSVFDPKSQEVVIYPSLLEAGQLLNIRSGEAQLQSFSLVDIQGRTVMQAPLEAGSIVHQIQMPVLPAGTYHVKLQSSRGPLFERIVIQ